jgi:hypothetical protein
MGMDVYGVSATTERGEYFRNNVWWWRPLWNYCVELAPELCGNVDGDTNGGDGLDAEGADDLSVILFNELASGRTAKYEQKYNEMIANLPRHSCKYCDGTGTRTDEVGQDMGMSKRELSPEIQIIAGRTHGWCNACNGEGKQDSWEASYPFSAENVREFAEFLADCGGFQIC